MQDEEATECTDGELMVGDRWFIRAIDTPLSMLEGDGKEMEGIA
jgi:hypothetical protein